MPLPFWPFLIFVLNLITCSLNLPIDSTANVSQVENKNTTIIIETKAIEKLANNSVSRILQYLDLKNNNLTDKVVQREVEDKSVSQVFQFPPQSFETQEDRKTQEEWGGNCTLGHWDKCKVIKTWFATHVNKSDPKQKDSEVDCKLEPVLCMMNGWTVNRCHILCMGSLCNKEIMYKFEKYVNHEGECKAHAHG